MSISEELGLSEGKDLDRSSLRTAYQQLNRVIMLPSMALVLCLPFMIDFVATRGSKVNILATMMFITPLLVLQAVNQNLALEAWVASIGERLPKFRAERKALYGKAVLLSIVGTVQSVAVILGVRVGFLPADPPADSSPWFNVVLIAVAFGVLAGDLGSWRRWLLMLVPPLVVGLGHVHLIDPVKVALWQSLYTCLILLMLLRMLTRESVDMAEAMVAETAEGDDGP